MFDDHFESRFPAVVVKLPICGVSFHYHLVVDPKEASFRNARLWSIIAAYAGDLTL